MKSIEPKQIARYSLLPLAIASSHIHAYSAIGTDNSIGSESNPSGLPQVCSPDKSGLTPYSNDSRTPTGFRYRQPCEKVDLEPNEDGWIVFGSIEAGAVGSTGDDSNAYFVEYADRSDQPVISTINVSALNAKSGGYARFAAGNIGLEDQHAELDIGRAGSSNIRVTQNKIQHVYATNAKTPYEGVGTGNLTLPPEIPLNSVASIFPGSTENLNSFVSTQPDHTLQVQRDRVGVSGHHYFSDTLKGFFDFKHEERKGSKALGAGFAFDFLSFLGTGGVVELPQPIDYSSQELTVGFHLTEESFNLSALYTNSDFENHIDTLNYENPWYTASFFGGSYSPQRGQTDLYPDNDFSQIKVDFDTKIPLWNGVFSATYSDGRMRQDDDLLPYTPNSGSIALLDQNTFAFLGMANLDLWNTTAALPRASADAKIDTSLMQFKLSLQPTEKLRINFRYRDYEEDNGTPVFETCNALTPTNQCAFFMLDAGLAAAFANADLFRLYDPANGFFANFHHRSIPWDHRKTEIESGIDYRLTNRTRLHFDYINETIERSYRETDETEEDQFILSMVHRDNDWGSVRIKLSSAYREYNGEYDYNPYEPFWTEHDLHGFVDDTNNDPALRLQAQAALDSLFPHTLAQLRKYDLSDRDQLAAAVKANFILGLDTDLLSTLDWKENDYKAEYGLLDEEQISAGIEINHALGQNHSVYGSYHYLSRESSMANIDATEVGTDNSAGGSFYPLSNAWGSKEEESSHLFSAGIATQLTEKIRVELDYSYGETDTELSYQGASVAAVPGAWFAFGVFPNPVGSFNDISYKQESVTLNVRATFTEMLSLRVAVYYEHGEIEDFHYDNIQYAEAAKLTLGTEVEDWEAVAGGIFLQYRF